ncbi:quinon protein alcohol dehydrogenase-like superfamily [Suillus bovinus]|uniref:quinon protein alcohol dehydrogenase-like superfamily n=1 Tax=Suillus bovinus TaxID=48563 RepID=UPI001B8770FD|nr:quinon protein alcohol dehydrogenase-like superfamily [Suillus bovinus]KAG2143534.1 quinon protein alcohol dehydrogenase-like superfamily [Suillus bovinus]
MSELVPTTTPLRYFYHHIADVTTVAVFPDRQQMVTGGLMDRRLCLWDLATGVMLKQLYEHYSDVSSLVELAVSRDGQLIASGHTGGEITVWYGETEKSTQYIKAHSDWICSLDFAADGTVLATGSLDKTTKLWNTTTWEQINAIECGGYVNCVRYSPSGEFLAIATSSIEIYNPGTRERVASLEAHTKSNLSLTWTPDGKRLLTAGDNYDPTIREWDALTWQQVGVPWAGHTDRINGIAINATGTLAASASSDNHVRLWQLSDQRAIVTFKHPSTSLCVTFSVDGKHILSGAGNRILEWTISEKLHPKKSAGRSWCICDLEDSKGCYSALLTTYDLCGMRVQSPDICDERGVQIHVSEYKTKLKEGSIVELEVILKLWTIKPCSNSSNPRDANGSHMMLQHMQLLPCENSLWFGPQFSHQPELDWKTVLGSRSSRMVPFWFSKAEPFRTIIDIDCDCDCDKVGLHIKLLSLGFALLVNQATFSLFKAPLICVPPIIWTEPSLSSILLSSTHKLQVPSAPVANKPSLFPTLSTPQITTTTAPTTSSTPSIPDFFAKPIAPLTPAPAAPFTTSSNAAPTSAPSTPAPLKFDFGKKPASTIPKPTAAPSPTTTVANAAKQTCPLFAFSAAAPQSSPLGASSHG